VNCLNETYDGGSGGFMTIPKRYLKTSVKERTGTPNTIIAKIRSLLKWELSDSLLPKTRRETKYAKTALAMMNSIKNIRLSPLATISYHTMKSRIKNDTIESK
jgi:hypothetical protein